MNNVIGKKIRKLTDILIPPIQVTYRISGVLLKNIGDSAIYSTVKDREVDHVALLNLLNEEDSWPLLLCLHASKTVPRHFAFIQKSGSFQTSGPNFRPEGKFFLLQFCEDISHSVEGTGSFAVVPLPSGFRDSDGDRFARLSYYVSRANDICKHISGQSLQSWGFNKQFRRDAVEDEYGNSLPIYRYDFKCSVLLIRASEE